jgi:acyl-CoA synthetase (AMP-forming)/AMP-acid ligase II
MLSGSRSQLMPLYHAGAAVIGMAIISAGSTLVIHQDFDPIAAIDSLINDEITVGGMVPAMVQACLVGVPDIRNKKFPLLKMMAYGASPIAEETLRSAMDVFGCDFVQIFGMTETSAAATSLLPDDHRKALDGRPELLLSAGRPVLGTEIRIVDETGEEVTRNTVGEVAVRGPQVMMGYWHLDEATTKSIRNGWMHTGDAAIMDEDGYIFIQDRIKDMIVSGGENIYPREIENALFEHPNLADAAAIGIPSEKWGEEILVFVVIKPGEEITEPEMIDFCRERLAGYKIPRKFEFIEELPRNATGKVLKKDLREPYWQGIDRRVG